MSSNIDVAGMEEERAEDVDDREAGAVRRRDDRETPPGRGGRRVRGPHDAIGGVEVGADLGAPEGMVAERDRVGAHREELIGETRRDSDAVGRVLSVHDADVDLELGPQRLQSRVEGPATGAPTTSAMKRMRRARSLRYAEGRRGIDPDRDVVAAVGGVPPSACCS